MRRLREPLPTPTIPKGCEIPDRTFPFRLTENGALEQFYRRSMAWKCVKGYRDTNGYLRTAWSSTDGTMAWMSIHRIVYILRYGCIPPGLEIDHIDGNRENNHPNNLRTLEHWQIMHSARIRAHKEGRQWGKTGPKPNGTARPKKEQTVTLEELREAASLLRR